MKKKYAIVKDKIRGVDHYWPIELKHNSTLKNVVETRDTFKAAEKREKELNEKVKK